MALGISGSNGGFGRQSFSVTAEQVVSPDFYSDKPLEISYFVNNVCNLTCTHCYVGYEHKRGALSSTEWAGCFDELIALGARTFGNVGKEPLIDWKLTRTLLRRFDEMRATVPGLRFGLVTNATLMDVRKRSELAEIKPDYIDVSIDGDERVHDAIRGVGTFRKTLDNLSALPEDVRQRVFISFTLNRQNAQSLERLIPQLYGLGIRHFLISPYVNLQQEGELYLRDSDLVAIVLRLLSGELVAFSGLEGARFYVKSDFTTTRGFMSSLVAAGAIDTERLLCDEYGAIFNRHDLSNDVTVYFNYYAQDPSFFNALRISHDGYFSRCVDMFYADYALRTIGNIRRSSAKQLLRLPADRLLQPEWQPVKRALLPEQRLSPPASGVLSQVT
ncbi:radical SAM protein [Sulfuritalea sp.]|uniref:radical SAM protein n=1 Tax=Sulfuritalea sp. TaxID=2480090 RepID=UPI00286E1A77|nr:radical SAM protein [Sulfuritalea sp.]